MIFARFVFLVLLMLCLCAPVPSAPFAMIVCGSGGEQEYSLKFEEWGVRLRNALVERCGFSDERVMLLRENEPRSELRSTRQAIGAQIERFKETVDSDDIVYLFLIGHGSHLSGETTFLIPGPDVSADWFRPRLEALGAGHVIMINGSSSSAGFINSLSREGWVIATATRSVDQVNAPEFMRFFIEGIEAGGADLNFDERVSLLEAVSRASQLTQAWYEQEGWLATEHALIDDNGDALGSRLPVERNENEASDGSLADSIFLKRIDLGADAPANLAFFYRRIMAQVETLIADKERLPEEFYYRQLENLLIKAARLRRYIEN